MSPESDELSTRLEQIAERCANASAAPWTAFIEGRDHTSGSNCIRTGGTDDLEVLGATPADLDFIAHARQDIPFLLEQLRRLRSPVEQL